MQDYRQSQVDVTVAQSATVSSGFRIPAWATFVGVYLPAMDNGNVGLHFSKDEGSNYVPILDPADAADLVVCASGEDPSAIDISDFVRWVPSGQKFLLRFS